MKKILYLLCFLSQLLLLDACSPMRFVPAERTLLAAVKLSSDRRDVKSDDYRTYVRQESNLRWLSMLKVPLGIYCLSGTNPRNKLNRIIQRVGEAPVVYNDTLMQQSRVALQQALFGRGYLHAQVLVEEKTKNRRTSLHYKMKPGRRHYVQDITQHFDNDTIERIVAADSANSKLYRGMPLDLTLLNAERDRIVALLKNAGYANVNNEFLSFTADTLLHSEATRLNLRFHLPKGGQRDLAYKAFRLGKIEIIEDFREPVAADTVFYRGLHFVNDGRQHIDKHVYYRSLFLQPHQLYSERATRYSYENLNALSAVDYATIHYSTPGRGDSTLDARIFVRINRSHNVSFDIGGTNTAGDLGGAATLTFSHRNLFRGAEQLSFKLRGAYEAITGLEGYRNQDFFEYSAETTLRLPHLLLPIGLERARRYRSTTDFSLLYNSQNRPEFHRRVLTAALSYQWYKHLQPNFRSHLDLVSLNYVYMPWISDTFRNSYLSSSDARYALLRSTYENLFIMQSAYGFTYSSLRATNVSLYQNNGYQIRGNVEIAGNLLYGAARLLSLPKQSDGRYAILGIPFSQYVKFDFDWAQSLRLNEYSSLAFHAAGGLAIPYGNSEIMPFEKRYFSGGANSVRGWSVRTLGPGSYVPEDGAVDFINQTGNLKLDFSAEYRSKLFWRFEGAAFVDAGNVWNTRNDMGKSDAQFRFSNFYKQIAVAYGLGLRLNLNYFIIRFDGGMKAINPMARGKLHYPIFRPNFSRDFALHFAVGLPF